MIDINSITIAILFNFNAAYISVSSSMYGKIFSGLAFEYLNPCENDLVVIHQSWQPIEWEYPTDFENNPADKQVNYFEKGNFC